MNRIVRFSAVAVLLLGLSGCGGDDKPQPPNYPKDSVRLQQNVPQAYGAYRLVAVNIDEAGGVVIVELPKGGNEKLPVKTGDTASTSDGALSIKVLAIEQPDGDQQAPGKGSGAIVVVPTTG